MKTGINGNIVGISIPIDGALGPLANNGGRILTIALLPGSPALNAGDFLLLPSEIDTDQRGTGFSRIVDLVDIGAYEAQEHLPIVDSVVITPTDPYSKQVVSTVVRGHDTVEGSITFSYQWYKSGVPIPDANSSTLDLSVLTLQDRFSGKRISVGVIPQSGARIGGAVISSEVGVRNVLPVVDSVTIVEAPNRVLKLVIASHDLDDDK